VCTRLEDVVAPVVDAIAENTGIASQEFLRLVVKDDAQHCEIVCAQLHHATTGEIVVELDIVFGCQQPRDHGICVDVHNVGGVDEGSK
jgi:hypothetical protein